MIRFVLKAMIRMSENDKIVEVQLHPFSANMEKLILNSSLFSPNILTRRKVASFFGVCICIYEYVVQLKLSRRKDENKKSILV